MAPSEEILEEDASWQFSEEETVNEFESSYSAGVARNVACDRSADARR